MLIVSLIRRRGARAYTTRLPSGQPQTNAAAFLAIAATRNLWSLCHPLVGVVGSSEVETDRRQGMVVRGSAVLEFAPVACSDTEKRAEVALRGQVQAEAVAHPRREHKNESGENGST